MKSIGILPKLAAAGAAILIAFGLCEIAARIIFPAPPQIAREPQLLFLANSDTGFLHVPNQTGWLDDGPATINALGLRGPAPVVPKPRESVRILAVGDSLTFGWGVGDSETYPAELERRLRQVFPAHEPSVVNAGVSAFDLEKTARLLRHFSPTLQPDIVLVGLFWNDLPYERVSPDGAAVGTAATSAPAPAPGPAPVSASVQTAASGAEVSKPFRLANQPSRLNRLLRSSRLIFALRHAWLSAIAPTSAASNQVQWEMAILEGRETSAIADAWRAVETILEDIKKQGDAQRFSVGIVVMPIRAQVESNHPRAAYQTRVRGIAARLGMFVVDPLARLRDHAGEGLFIPYDRMHFTARGNAELAAAVFETLRARPEFLQHQH